MELPAIDHSLARTSIRVWSMLLVGLCSMAAALETLNRQADAAEWSAAPSMSVKGAYNSNLLLNSGHNEVFGYWITPAVKFRGATETLDIEGETRADFVHYFGDQDREFTNVYFPLRASYRSERHTLGFAGGFTRDNTLRGELQQTGLVLGFTQRSMWTAVPTWTIGITERLSWQSSYQFMDAQYQDGRKFGLADYQVHGVVAGPTYNVSELDQIHMTGEFTRVRIPLAGLESTYYGAQGGWTHDFGHEVTGSISGGGRLVSSTQDIPAIPGILGILLGRSSNRSVTSHEIVWVFRGSLRKQFERSMVEIEGSREINPSGFGRLLQTDRVGGLFSHNLTETLTASLNGALYFVSGITTTEGSLPLNRTRFFSVGPTLSWKFAQWWSVDVSYTYGERAVDGLDQRNGANSTFIMLTYMGDKWSVSR
ncbi:hypothetical protein ACYX34_01505 [Nitrospira sp. CMX1]|nr:hypothetical protein [Nitrospira sp.]